MVCDIGSTIKGLCGSTFSSTFLNSIFGNIFKFSLLVVVVIMLIIMLIYPSKYGTSFMQIFKIFVYLYTSVFILNVFHNGVLRHNYESQIKKNETNELLDKISGGDRNLIPSESSINILSKLG